MRILLGADLETPAEHTPSVGMLKRLRFSPLQIDVVHVVHSVPPLYTDWAVPSVLAEVAREDHDAAKSHLQKIVAEFGEGMDATAMVTSGNPTACLMAHADETNADLVVVNGTVARPLAALLTGSVSRGLVIGAHQSVLLVRGESDALRPLRVVLATDHSPYAERCMERLISFWPQGIQFITVLTAFPEERVRAMEPLLPHMGVAPSKAIHEVLETKNKALIEKLGDCFHPILTTFDSWVSPLPVHEAIIEAMKETNAELLILGAHGHSFLERLTLGSTSFREAVFSPYSVLVLREALA